MFWEKILTIGPAFFLFVVAEDEFEKGNRWLAFILACLGFLFAFFSEILNLVRETIKKPVANWIVSKLEILWLRLTSRFQSKYYRRLISKCRDYRTQGLKKGAFVPLVLEKVFVPLHLTIPKSLDEITPGIIQASNSAGEHRIWDFLAHKSDYRRIAVLGPPGSGKTTLLESLALTYAQKTQRQQHRKVPSLIPVLLYLRDVREVIADKQPPNLAKLLEQQEWIQKLSPPPNWFEHKLMQGKCLVMLDGLDEMANEIQHKRVSQWVDKQMQDYPDAIFILTSRPYGYPNTSMEQRCTVAVEGFNHNQIRQFIHNWYLQHEIMSHPLRQVDPGLRTEAKNRADNLINRIMNNPSLAEMAPNPLLLTMIATVQGFQEDALPGRRVELYDEICNMLLGQRRAAKGIPDTLLAARKKLVLQVLALKLMQEERFDFSLDTGSSWIEEKLAAVAGSGAEPARFLKHIENGSGLLVEREQGFYEFAHKSFQEYLAAVQIKELNQEYLLTESIDDLWWEGTIRLYAAQSDATNLIQAALDATNLTPADQEEPNVNALTLAYNCLEERLSVQPKVREELEYKLEMGLKSTRSYAFKLAAKVKLSQRLKELLWIDEKVAIDLTYITCAEYQLFIDQKQEVGEDYSPAHWQTDRFLPENATRPVTGVQARDAEKFCEWLTQEYSTSEFKYRLPNLTEEEVYPATERQIGCWCNIGENKVIGGVEHAQWQDRQENLAHAIDSDLDGTLAHTSDKKLDLTLAHILTRDLEHFRNFAQDSDLKPTFDLIRACAQDLDQALDYVLTCAQDLGQSVNKSLTQAQALVQVLEQAHAPDNVFDYPLALAGELAQALNRILDGARSHATNLAEGQAFNEAISYKLACGRARDFAQAQAQVFVRTFFQRRIDPASALDLNRIYTPDYALDCDHVHTLIRNFHHNRNRVPDPFRTRTCLLLICILWDFLSKSVEAISESRRLSQSRELTRQQCEVLRHKYVKKRSDTFNLYAISVLINERRKEQMPAWEGIRIVRERVQQ